MSIALIVEDDLRLRADLTFMLRDEGFEVTALESAEEALERLGGERPPPHLLLLDVRLPGMSGVDLVRRLVELDRLPPTIVVSGEASIDETVEALKLGVHDFLEKPFHRQRLMRSIRNTLDHAALRRRVARLESELAGPTPILGGAAADPARRGAGGRAEGPYVKLNCAAIPAQLVEDELFGHVRGAFTDARADKPGLFEEADRGTLFLDEIGDMGLDLQSRLLRVLEDGVVRRVGEQRGRRVDVRVIAATHADLEAAVEERRFRRDLYYRLAHLPIDVPPLRRRGDDVRLLFEHFFAGFCARGRRRRPRVEPAVMARLAEWSWPGNVRELRSLAERLAVLAGDPIDLGQLPEPYLGGKPAAALPVDPDPGVEIVELREFRRRCEKRYIEAVLERTGWNVSRAARLLGIHRSRLHRKLNELGTRRPRGRG